MDLVRGIIPPLITPLVDDDTLDTDGLEKLLDHVIAGGVHGIFILGTTGEGASLSCPLKEEFIERACQMVDGRVPVLVNITDPSFRESLKLAEKAKDAGARAVAIAPPFYFLINDLELENHFESLIAESPLPVFLYNYPALTKVNISLKLFKNLLKNPNLGGMKDSSGDLKYFSKILKLKEHSNFSLLTGPEELLFETLLMGGDGGIPGGANMFPDLYVSLFNNVQKRHHEEAFKIHQKILQISSIVYSGDVGSSGNVISGIKTALSFMGICMRHVAKPLLKVSDKKQEEIQRFIERKLDENSVTKRFD